MPSLAAVTGQSSADLFGAGKYAMITNGSWMIGQMYGYKGVETGVAPTPIGPSGKRASMYNGLADSIWVGIEEQAGCGEVGRVPRLGRLPEHRRREGRRLPGHPDRHRQGRWPRSRPRASTSAAFTVHVKDKTTFLFPITDYASQIDGIMHPAMDAVVNGKAEPSSLTEANNEVNALFG